MIARAPPVAGLAAGFALGVALLPHAGYPRAAALSLTILLLLVQLFRRPLLSTSLILAVSAGAAAGWVSAARSTFDCRWSLPDGFSGALVGRFTARPGVGAAPFRVVSGFPRGCAAIVPARLGRDAEAPAVGVTVRAHGRWLTTPRPRKGRPDLAGVLFLDSLVVARDPPGATIRQRIRARMVRSRGSLQATLHTLFPETAPLAEALILARKESLTPERREIFARSGTAHLLAISGFHVGVLAGLMMALARLAGAGPRRATFAAALGAWAYVAFIGAPDAASRAALILSLFVVGRLLGRPVLPSGALATAFLLLLLVDPAALGRPGLQLSFAGAAGLLYGMKPISALLARGWTGRTPSVVRTGIAAGVSASLATLPLVAWHFDRVSLVGIPATLMAAPLVALAIPGLLAVLLSAPVWPGFARFLAGGVDLVLRALEVVVKAWAGLPFASVWLPRLWVAGGVLGAIVALWYVRRRSDVGRRTRFAVVVLGLAGGWIGSPIVGSWAGGDSVEFFFLDVGQGDAIVIRSPKGRWILVDAGPRSRSFDAGRRVVVPFLRRHGVRRLEALILTHPDLDHMGGAAAVIENLNVGVVVDPATAVAKEEYATLLSAAASVGASWMGARAGTRFDLDGVSVTILAPEAAGTGAGRTAGEDLVASGAPIDANERSVVLELRYGAFRAILTGDAPTSVERRLIAGAASGPLQLLKVGHHGSATSTSADALEVWRPAVAVISVGARNRYRHPAREVTDRLERAGAWILRTDRDGTISLRGRKDGSYRITTERR
ncbi:MAG: DNA internalization-related competence protein ComEC/Rec2 [Gemmatimonadota bacterium]|nr:MAG: DNA internalization-related competence protein ComEC/Rec2 [Gemmatimonadota bacterium]